MYIASANNAAFGALGAGGLALCMAVFLILAVRGKGRVKLTHNPALIFGFLAGTAFNAAGQMWANPQQLTEQGLQGIGVGGGHHPFGNVTVGAASLLLLIIMLCAKITPLFGAILGIASACVWPLAGTDTIWNVPVDLAAGVLMMFGSG
ncbi:hypothetical protein ACIP98_21100 [Streptomyces sp. NPDC088354]|uniref:hypothetical protein n=1 Tax=Streptomyces sp. NPDC088354 TaxID=3365856 RepID=UPI0038093AC7